MPNNCTTTSQGCTECPAIAARAYKPPQYNVVTGWNAGANSINRLDGNIHTVFQVPPSAAGVVVGFKGDRANATDPTAIEHGLLFSRSGGVCWCRTMESGVVGPIEAGFDDSSWSFELRRVNGVVSYYRSNGGTPILISRSPTHSLGPKVVNACLYSTGDEVL